MRKIAVCVLAVSALAAGSVAYATSAGADTATSAPQLSATVTAYSYADDIFAVTVTTGDKAIYNLQVATPGFPGYASLNWETVASAVPANTTETLPFDSGAFYINANVVLRLLAQYQTGNGVEHQGRVRCTFAIQPPS